MSDEQLIWDMPKVRKWIDGGAKPDGEGVVDIYTLGRMESDGLVKMREIAANGKSHLVVLLTAEGNFEADRLEALQAAAEAAEVTG